MLNKKELNLIPNKQPSPAVCEILEDKKICVDFSLEKPIRKKYLVMWIYEKIDNNSKKLILKVCFRKTKNTFEWLVKNMDKNTWGVSTLSNLYFYHENGYKDYIFYQPYWHNSYDCRKDLGMINSQLCLEYFNFIDENSFIDEIDNMQIKKRETACKINAQKKQQPINALMSKVPSLPKNFSKWVNDTVLYESRYGVYTLSAKKQKSCVCTHCDAEFLIDKSIRTNTTGICPSCKSTLIFKSSGRVSIRENSYCTIVQKLKGTKRLVIRHFTVNKEYKKGDFLNVVPTYHEVGRDIYNPTDKSIEQYQIRYGVKYFDQPIWRIGRLTGNWFSTPLFAAGRNYTANLTSTIKDTDFKYSGIQYFPPLYKYDVCTFFENFLNEPWREYLVKNKLYNLAVYSRSGVKLDFSQKTLSGKLRLSNEYLEECIKDNVTYDELSFFQCISLNSIPLSHPLVELARSSYEEAIYHSRYSSFSYQLCKLLNFCYEKKISGISCMNYLNDSYKTSGYDSLINYTSDYLDYLRNVLLIEKSIENRRLKPRNFKKSHDTFADLAVVVKNKEVDIGIQNRYVLVGNTFEMTYKSFSFKFPKSLQDFITEGKILHHCVGGISYGKQHANGEIYIVFVRNSENTNKPLYTLEINNKGNILQCRGLNNCSCPEKDMKIIKSYVNIVMKKLKNRNLKQVQQPANVVA